MRIFVKKSSVKQLLKIPQRQRVKIEGKISQLQHNPTPPQSIKLVGRPAYRLRVGDYRVLYSVNRKRKAIDILSAQHRKDAYR